MKTFPWIIAGASIGAAIYFALNRPSPAYATGYGTGYTGVDKAAGDTAAWGTKQRLSGTGTSVLGKIKEGVGQVTGNPDLQDEGTVDQAVGSVKDTAGKVANAAAQTLHDLNI